MCNRIVKKRQSFIVGDINLRRADNLGLLNIFSQMSNLIDGLL